MTASREEKRAHLALAAAAVLAALVILAIHRESPRTAISAHGMLHSALTVQIASAPLELPPENPFFAGEPVRYYWFFHGLGAAIGGVLGTAPLQSLEILIVLGTIALFPIAGALSRSLYGRALPGLVLAFLVLAGAKPLAGPVAAWSYATGGPGARDGAYLWGLVHPVMKAMRLYDPYSMWGPLLNFFLNITSRPLAIVSLLAMILALHGVLQRGGLRRALLLTTASALCGAFSMLIGLSGAGALAGGVGLVAMLGQIRGPGAPGSTLVAHAPLAITALIGGQLLASITFWHVVFGPGGDSGLALAAPSRWFPPVAAIAESALLTLPLGLWAAWTSEGARRDFLWVLLAASAAFMAASVLTSLPIGSQNNFFQAALVPIAVCATAGLVDASGRLYQRRTALVVAAFVPGALMILFAYHGRPDVPLGFADGRLVRIPAEAPLANLYDFIRTRTDERAIVVIEPSKPIRAALGNTAELPAMTERALFTLRPNHYIASDYPDIDRRVQIAETLVSGLPLDPADLRYVAALGRPVYILVDDVRSERTQATVDALRALHGRPAHQVGPLQLYRLELSGESS